MDGRFMSHRRMSEFASSSEVLSIMLMLVEQAQRRHLQVRQQRLGVRLNCTARLSFCFRG